MTEEYIVRILDNEECITEGMLTRCSDCVHRGRWFGEDHYCMIVSSVMPEDGYCSKAERKQPYVRDQAQRRA